MRGNIYGMGLPLKRQGLLDCSAPPKPVMVVVVDVVVVVGVMAVVVSGVGVVGR